MALHGSQSHRVPIIRLLRRLIHHREHPLRPGQSREHIAHLHGDLIDGPGKLPGKIQKHRQPAHVKILPDTQNPTDAGSQGVIDLA